MYTILIVDDDTAFLGWLKFGLEGEGKYVIVTAETMNEGLAALHREKIGLAVVDAKLPDGDGFELCNKIKEYDKNIPVILVTGVFKEYETWQKGIKSGVNDVLIKPFSYERLVQRIELQLKTRLV